MNADPRASAVGWRRSWRSVHPERGADGARLLAQIQLIASLLTRRSRGDGYRRDKGVTVEGETGIEELRPPQRTE